MPWTSLIRHEPVSAACHTCSPVLYHMAVSFPALILMAFYEYWISIMIVPSIAALCAVSGAFAVRALHGHALSPYFRRHILWWHMLAKPSAGRKVKNMPHGVM